MLRALSSASPASLTGSASSLSTSVPTMLMGMMMASERKPTMQNSSKPMRRILRYMAASMPAHRITSASLMRTTCAEQRGGQAGARGVRGCRVRMQAFSRTG